MGRRRFEYFHVELSLALDRLVPRYALWLGLSGFDCDPEDLDPDALLGFFDVRLDAFLDQQGMKLDSKRRARLRRRLQRYNPANPTPYEFMERLASAAR